MRKINIVNIRWKISNLVDRRTQQNCYNSMINEYVDDYQTFNNNYHCLFHMITVLLPIN